MKIFFRDKMLLTIFFLLIIPMISNAQSGGSCVTYPDTPLPVYEDGTYSCAGTLYVGSINTFNFCGEIVHYVATGNSESVFIYNCLDNGCVEKCGCYVRPPLLGWESKDITFCYPVADFRVTQSPTNPTGTNIVYFYSESYDTDGEIVSYEWKINGNLVAAENNGKRVKFATRFQRTVTVSLTVKDNDGLVSTFTDDVLLDAWSCGSPCILH